MNRSCLWATTSGFRAMRASKLGGFRTLHFSLVLIFVRDVVAEKLTARGMRWICAGSISLLTNDEPGGDRRCCIRYRTQ